MMRPEERAERVAELFDQALEQPTAERPHFLALNSSDPELRAEVESLLRAAQRAGGFMEKPLAAPEPAGAFPSGAVFGHYEVLSLIGKGGMGEVYLAQDCRVHRQVALKLVRGGLDRDLLTRRFQREQELLASLNHPNIAQLFETGVSDEGIPYFAMEYVEGQRLDEFVAARALSLTERVQLFRKVCAAVAYAHQHLVIHRDIKPANIRVTAGGEPKLLDFGIAKLLDEMAENAAAQTLTMHQMLTPDYASPEQVRGEHMSTASDIYSLGVVLYELLAGQKPYRLTSRHPEEITRAITAQQPARSKSLPGDLNNIVLMAMRKEPARRYASVAQFSDDLRRYLENRSVLARKDTLGYRATKFLKRNKVSAAAAALVFLSLSGGVVVSMYEARRAERRFNDVRQLANSLMFEIHDSVQDLQGSTPTRRLIVERALRYLDSLNAEAGSNPSLQRELATAYEKVGDIQGNPYTANLGDTDGALSSYRKATEILERLSKREATQQTRFELALSYRALGDIMELKGEIAECLRHYQHSLALIEQLAADYPNDVRIADELARAHETLGDGFTRTDENSERLRNYKLSLEIRSGLLTQDPDNRKKQRSVAVALMKIAGVPGVAKEEAVEKMQRSVEMLESIAAADPQNARARREIGYASYQLGMILTNAGDHGGALGARQKALQIREEFAANDRSNRQARFDLAVAHGDLAETYTKLKDAPEALKHARQCLDVIGEMSAADPNNAINARNLGLGYERLADALDLAARDEAQTLEQRAATFAEARDAYRNALEVFTGLRNRGALVAVDAKQIEKFTRRVAAMNEAMAQLR